MKRFNIANTAAVLMLLTSVTLHAQGTGGGSANKPPKQNTAQAVKPQTTKTAPSTQAKAPKAAQAPKTPTAKAHPTKTQTTTQTTKTTKTTKTTQNAKASPKSGKTTTTTNAADTTSNAGTSTTSNTETSANTSPTSNTVTLSPVQQKLTKNTNLASKLQSRLPEGTNLMRAADGFKNLGQFVAAVNVSNNLNISFAKLKTAMVKENLSLGQAIQELKPTASGTIEAQRAEYDARGMISETEQAQNTTPATTTTTSSKKSSKNSSGGGSDE